MLVYSGLPVIICPLASALLRLEADSKLGCEFSRGKSRGSSYRSDERPSIGGGDGFLPVFGETTASPEPCKGALDAPSSRDDDKAVRTAWPLDDFDSRPIEGVDRLLELVAAIAAIGDDAGQRGVICRHLHRHAP